MGVNKVKYGNNTVIDISNDTVTPDKLLQGYTAHDNTGALITGTAELAGNIVPLTVIPSSETQVFDGTTQDTVFTVPSDNGYTYFYSISQRPARKEYVFNKDGYVFEEGKIYNVTGVLREDVSNKLITFSGEWSVSSTWTHNSTTNLYWNENQLPYTTDISGITWIGLEHDEYNTNYYITVIYANSNNARTLYVIEDLVFIETDQLYDGYLPVTVNSVNLDGKVYQDGDGYVVLDDDEGTHKEIDALTVATNGTYTAPTGHAYDRVTVNVPTGGGGSSSDKKQINFIDYDGTVLHSYTPTEWSSVSALPSNPSHSGLVAQGWNWTKAQIDSQLTAQPEADILVGQMYETASGKTEININVDNPKYLSPYLAIAVNGTATIDWGDGTSTNTITGTSYTGLKYTHHTYATTGRYTISIDGPIGFYCASSSYGALLTTTATSSTRRTYSQYIEAIRCAANIRIGTSAFTNCYALQSITIPDGVTSIGNGAFQDCCALRSITIPDGVTSIGGSTFSGCRTLQSITIPDGVTSIGASAFQSCCALQSITIPDGVTSIEGSVFQNCYALQSITIPDGVTSIGGSTFSSCYALQSITIPDGVTSIGTSAFQGCYALQSITIPDGVTSIENSTFSGCYALQSITIPDGVTRIGTYAFSSCYALKSITIPDGVTSIGTYAFQYCYALQSITIPDGVTSIENNTFLYCSTLQSITIPDGVTSIGTTAFQYCYALQSITIPDGVTSIGTYAFQNCYALQSITIPDGVTSIGTSVFQNCRALQSITIPDGITSIGNSAFTNCYSVMDYHILSVTPPTLGTSVFNGIASGTKIHVPAGSLEAYQTATNWSAYASYMEEE